MPQLYFVNRQFLSSNETQWQDICLDSFRWVLFYLLKGHIGMNGIDKNRIEKSLFGLIILILYLQESSNAFKIWALVEQMEIYINKIQSVSGCQNLIVTAGPIPVKFGGKAQLNLMGKTAIVLYLKPHLQGLKTIKAEGNT